MCGALGEKGDAARGAGVRAARCSTQVVGRPAARAAGAARLPRQLDARRAGRRWPATTGRCCRCSATLAGRHALPRAVHAARGRAGRAARAAARRSAIGVGVVNQKLEPGREPADEIAGARAPRRRRCSAPSACCSPPTAASRPSPTTRSPPPAWPRRSSARSSRRPSWCGAASSRPAPRRRARCRRPGRRGRRARCALERSPSARRRGSTARWPGGSG